MDDLTRVAIKRIHRTHEWLLCVTEELTEEQWAWVPSSTAPSISWHFWHIARETDRLLFQLSHASRHLGLIKALCGVLELRDTATV
jgi:hypothetical protein